MIEAALAALENDEQRNELAAFYKFLIGHNKPPDC